MRVLELGLPVLVGTLLSALLVQGCTNNMSFSSATSQTTSAALQPASVGQSDGSLRVVQTLPAPTDQAGGSEQPLSVGDVIEVDVFQVDNLDRTAQVDATGRISLALIGSVAAKGKTVGELEREIEGAYGANYLQSPDVTIFVKESAGQRVTLDGEVAKAGIYPVTGQASLLDAIALAGGFRQVADDRKVFVYREHNGQQLVANYNVKEIREGKLQNPRIYGGDVIVVFASQSKVALQNLKEALGVASSATGLAVF